MHVGPVERHPREPGIPYADVSLPFHIHPHAVLSRRVNRDPEDRRAAGAFVVHGTNQHGGTFHERPRAWMNHAQNPGGEVVA